MKLKILFNISTAVALLLSINIGIADSGKSPITVKVKQSDKPVISWYWQSADQSIYPFLEIRQAQLIFRAHNSEIRAKFNYLSHSKIKLSPDKKFIGFFTKKQNEENDSTDGRIKKFAFTVASETGELVYEIPLKLNYDEPLPAGYVIDNGQSILADGFRGKIEIFKANGELQRIIDLFAGDDPALERPLSCDVRQNGDRFVVVSQKQPMTFDEKTSRFVSGEPYVFCFSATGELIWKNKIPSIQVSEVAISKTGSYVAVGHSNPSQKGTPELMTTIYNRDGREIMDVPLLFRYTRFFESQSKLYLADRDELISVNLKNKTYRTLFKLSGSGQRMITKLTIDETSLNSIILTANSVFQNDRFEFIGPELIEIDTAGKRIWELEFENERFIEPSLFLNNNIIGVGFNDNYQIYREKRED